LKEIVSWLKHLNASFITLDSKIFSKKFVAMTLLTGGSLAWFFLIWIIREDIFSASSPGLVSLGQMLFYGFAVFSALIGMFLVRRVDLQKFFLLWVSLGLASTIVTAFSAGTVFSLFSSAFLGFSLGLGLPSSMAFFASSTAPGERARVGGTIILGTFVLAVLGIAGSSVIGFGTFGMVIVYAVVRSTSFLALLLDKFKVDKEKVEVHLFKPAYREFVYYLVPWFIFNIAADLALNLIPSTSQYESVVSLGNILRFPFIAIFGFMAGVLADRFGRKQGVIIGLVMLGAGFAILGFFMQPLSVIAYYVISGVAWGSLLTIYLVIPGDLSSFDSREQFYVLGTIVPLIVMAGFPLLPGLDALAKYASPFSQILSLLLFLSVIPILRAKETLSESQIRARKMKEYLDKVGKLIKEYKGQ
jgi:MFS family permease